MEICVLSGSIIMYIRDFLPQPYLVMPHSGTDNICKQTAIQNQEQIQLQQQQKTEA